MIPSRGYYYVASPSATAVQVASDCCVATSSQLSPNLMTAAISYADTKHELFVFQCVKKTGVAGLLVRLASKLVCQLARSIATTTVLRAWEALYCPFAQGHFLSKHTAF
jgi:hypothetical protein